MVNLVCLSVKRKGTRKNSDGYDRPASACLLGAMGKRIERGNALTELFGASRLLGEVRADRGFVVRPDWLDSSIRRRGCWFVLQLGGHNLDTAFEVCAVFNHNA